MLDCAAGMKKNISVKCWIVFCFFFFTPEVQILGFEGLSLAQVLGHHE